jgi:CDP-glycerol glycerophosphotransferase (TagB/SpsB family)
MQNPVVNLYKKYKQIKNKQQHILSFRKGQSQKIDNKAILLESLHGKSVDGHIFQLIKSIKKLNLQLKIYVVTKNSEESQIKFRNHGIDNITFVEHLSKEYGHLLATSKYLINDNTFFPFFSKREGQKYYNVWHGTPLKTLGKDMEDIIGYSNVQRNFLLADAIIVSNEYTKDILIKSHNIDKIYSGKVVVAPSPRNSPLFDEILAKQIREKHNWQNKKIVMYMPTWRGVDGKVVSDDTKLIQDLSYLSHNMEKDTIIVFKRHTMQKNVNIDSFDNIIDFPREYELYHFLSCVDVLITDYSSIMYDFANKKSQIILYTYDKEEYFSTRGVYEDIDTYPFVQANTIEELTSEINHPSPTNDYHNFIQKFCSLDNIDGSKMLAEYIINGTKTEYIQESSIRNDKQNVFVFCGGLWDNGITTALLNTLDAIDTTKRNYILVFGKGKMKEQHKFRLKLLPENVQYYPIPGISINSLFERVIYKKYLKKETHTNFENKIVQKIFSREIRRIFGETEIDWFIHYTGFDRKYAELVTYLPNKTMIFVHTDMFEDYKNKKNYNQAILYKAYRSVNKIVLVNENLRQGFVENLPDVSDKLEVMNNFLGENRIRELGKQGLFSTLKNVGFHHVNSTNYVADPIQRFMNNSVKQSSHFLKSYEESLHSYKNSISKYTNDPFIEKELVASIGMKDLILENAKKEYLASIFPYREALINEIANEINHNVDAVIPQIDNVLFERAKLLEATEMFPYAIDSIADYQNELMEEENNGEPSQL